MKLDIFLGISVKTNQTALGLMAFVHDPKYYPRFYTRFALSGGNQYKVPGRDRVKDKRENLCNFS